MAKKKEIKEVVCFCCDGKGEYSCHECGGSGKLGGDDEHGYHSSNLDCPKCENGIAQCPECYGTGKKFELK